MLQNKDALKIVAYWIEQAKYDFATAKGLFKIKRYPYCLFICHLSLEKLLKAGVVKKTGQHAPFSHNLVLLAEKTGIKFTSEDLDVLAEMNEFNLEARYPDIKTKFYKKVTRKYAENYLLKTEGIKKWLLKALRKS